MFLDPAAVAGHAGTYELPSGARLEFAALRDGLLLRMPGQGSIPLHARTAGRFFAEAVDLDLDVTAEDVTLSQGRHRHPRADASSYPLVPSTTR